MDLNGKFFVEYGKISTDKIIPLINSNEDSQELWGDNFREKYYPSQRNTQNLAFTWTPILDQPVFNIYTDSLLLKTPIGQAYKALTDQVLELVPGTVIKGAIVRMPPKSVIYYHIDGSHELWKQCRRLHLPIITEPEVEFHYKFSLIQEGPIHHVYGHLTKDILVEINNLIPHGVIHKGKSLRYHLIYDILPANYSGQFTVVEHNDQSKIEFDRLKEINECVKYRIPIDRTIYKF